MVRTAAIITRPSITQPCTCIWAALDEQREVLADDEQQSSQSTLNQVAHTLNPLNAISSLSMFGGHKGPEDASSTPEDLPAISPASPLRDDSRSPAGQTQHLGGANNVSNATRKANKISVANASKRPFVVDPKFGTILPEQGDSAIVARMEKKADILHSSGWLGKARPSKIFGKSAEVKVGELISYREDLVYVLESLIPCQRLHDQGSTHPPAILPVPHTPLCATCQQKLAYSLYNAPAAHNVFIRESATSAFLALVDDCTASLKASLPLEHITHHDIDSVLRRELAVVEWRVAANLAKFHKKTGFLKEFPVRLGEYGQFQVNVKPPGAPSSIISKVGQKVKSAVGVGGEPPSGHVQGPPSNQDS